MCKSRVEGGQRCPGFARARVVSIRERYAESGSQVDLQAVSKAETEYASTLPRYAEAVGKAAAGEPGPGGLPSGRWVRITEEGEALRERNAGIALAFNSPPMSRAGAVFHADAQVRMGGHELPKFVQGPRALNKFLRSHESSVMDYVRFTERFSASWAASSDSLLAEVEAAVPDPFAPAGSRVPRSAAEKEDWVNYLSEGRNHLDKELADGRAKSLASVDILDRFDKPTQQLTSALAEPMELVEWPGKVCEDRFEQHVSGRRKTFGCDVSGVGVVAGVSGGGAGYGA